MSRSMQRILTKYGDSLAASCAKAAAKVIHFLAGFLRDPNSDDGSSTRIAGLFCVIVGCELARSAMRLQWYIVTNKLTVELPWVGITSCIATILVSGGVAFLLRKKADE